MVETDTKKKINLLKNVIRIVEETDGILCICNIMVEFYSRYIDIELCNDITITIGNKEIKVSATDADYDINMFKKVIEVAERIKRLVSEGE